MGNNVYIYEMIKDIIQRNNIDIVAIQNNLTTHNNVVDTCGCYMITTISNQIYIGSTINLRKRIQQHILISQHWKRYSRPGNFIVLYIKEPIKSIDIYTTKTIQHARRLECYMISRLRPTLNRIIESKKLEREYTPFPIGKRQE